jgi:hypothetical protein
LAYVLPTLAEFRARFPELATVPDSVASLALEEAGREVDDSWTERGYHLGALYFAAHLVALALRQGASSDSGGGGGAIGQAVRSVRYKDRAVQYYNLPGQSSGMGGGGGAVGDEIDSTIYGQLYKRQLKRNVPSILVLDDAP